jgi:hypothetical protein
VPALSCASATILFREIQSFLRSLEIMDNKAIAGILYETADLMEIDGQDSFRVRSYRNAAQAIEALPEQVADLIEEPKKLLEVPGIGKGMVGHLQHLFKEGTIEAHSELLKKYRPLRSTGRPNTSMCKRSASRLLSSSRPGNFESAASVHFCSASIHARVSGLF